ncbi:hypothetical protein PoB_001786500 [Plakobranchus ocellatus]|uniref:Uncharacterized protein n=1 Tax=Plakobranchus ocellatus TaxID=259542 RepID=A0AAV3Z9Z5_9GAST|nr:hypothetical protein PoB_001786500 [Plakobranchus ocellatus]
MQIRKQPREESLKEYRIDTVAMMILHRYPILWFGAQTVLPGSRQSLWKAGLLVIPDGLDTVRDIPASARYCAWGEKVRHAEEKMGRDNISEWTGVIKAE